MKIKKYVEIIEPRDIGGLSIGKRKLYIVVWIVPLM